LHLLGRVRWGMAAVEMRAPRKLSDALSCSPISDAGRSAHSDGEQHPLQWLHPTPPHSPPMAMYLQASWGVGIADVVGEALKATSYSAHLSESLSAAGPDECELRRSRGSPSMGSSKPMGFASFRASMVRVDATEPMHLPPDLTPPMPSQYALSPPPPSCSPQISNAVAPTWTVPQVATGGASKRASKSGTCKKGDEVGQTQSPEPEHLPAASSLSFQRFLAGASMSAGRPESTRTALHQVAGSFSELSSWIGVDNSDFPEEEPRQSGLLEAMVTSPVQLQLAKVAPAVTSSVGSAHHEVGRCKPCAFVHRETGCSDSYACTFCHLCLPGERQRRRKQKTEAMRERRLKRSGKGEDSPVSAAAR